MSKESIEELRAKMISNDLEYIDRMSITFNILLRSYREEGLEDCEIAMKESFGRLLHNLAEASERIEHEVERLRKRGIENEKRKIMG